MTTTPKDLTKEAATSPSTRVGGYVILARMADKARAEFFGGNVGEYHTDCPLDHMLLDWKEVPYAEIKEQIVAGADNDQIAAYLDTHGATKTKAEVEQWAAEMEKVNPYFSPEKKEWFAGECAKLDLNPATTTLFRWLDVDDENTFGK